MSASRTDRLAGVLHRTGALRALARMPAWRGTLVLCYHRVGDGRASPFDRALFSATAEDFDEQMAWLARHTEVVGPGAVLGRRPGRRVVLTFDDGYRDNHDVALPILRRHGLTATFFLATGFLDEPRVPWWDEIAWMVRRDPRAADPERSIKELLAQQKALPGERTEEFLDDLSARTGSGRAPREAAKDMWMTWDMARVLRDSGMEVGGHTVNHPILSRVDGATQRREVSGCAARLRDELGLPLRWFSYPNGDRDSYDSDTRAALREHGVEVAFSFAGGYLRREGASDPLDVPRASVGRSTTRQRFRAAVALPRVFARW